MKLYHKLSIENLDWLLNNQKGTETQICCSSENSTRLFSLGNRMFCLEIEVDEETFNNAFCSMCDHDANRNYGYDEYRLDFNCETSNYRIICQDGIKDELLETEEWYILIEDNYSNIENSEDTGISKEFLNFN